jgi:molybdate transport system substrate-binding protein
LNFLLQKAEINFLSLCFLSFLLALFPRVSLADELRVAVASNFYSTIKVIAEQFELKTTNSSGQQHKVILIPGSSGKHYAQIINGAPFDIFFSADTERARLLEQSERAESGTRFTYALGKLILWSPMDNYVDLKGEVLKSKDFRYLAIANPKLAPYGKAAEEVLKSLNIWTDLGGRIVRGENIAQTFQFVSSGNAKLGFVAHSQIKSSDLSISGSFWEVPQSIYRPIEQQAVLLRDSALAREFLSFVKSTESLSIIYESGYGLP